MTVVGLIMDELNSGKYKAWPIEDAVRASIDAVAPIIREQVLEEAAKEAEREVEFQGMTILRYPGGVAAARAIRALSVRSVLDPNKKPHA